jgi:tRNA-2-methylthio-N6-dimethylallyladenosine synthase
MRRFLLQTFGCQMNMHDSRRIEEVLYARGYEATDAPELADLIVFNTCSIREKADHKLLSTVGTFRSLKERKRGLVIAVAGCMAQQQGEALLDRSDLVDIVLGPDNIPELPGLVQHVQDGGQPIARTVFDLEQPAFLTARVRPDRPEITSYVTVMKGCDERCTYCIVPYTRGSERYRAATEIVSEIKTLCEGGVREITLLGQTVNSWHEPVLRRELIGSPLSAAAAAEVLATDSSTPLSAADVYTPLPAADVESQFAELVRRIAREVPELARLRYTSPHPRHITDALVDAHRELSILPAHVHLPVQSGSDRVLRRMLRRYRRQTYIERARALQASRPGFTLSTDIIVGFPGETDQDFEDTLSLVREVGFVSVFGFKYSPRPHTPALRLGDDISEELKSERLARLFATADELQTRHHAQLVGTMVEVLIDGPSKEQGHVAGRSERHELVHVAVPSGTDWSGRVVRARVTQAKKRSLMAVLEMPLTAAVPTQSASTRKTAVRLPLLVS